MAAQPRYVSTSKASEILGVSITLIKSLVDEHKLRGWKTQGGHRRISLDSIEAYLLGFERPAQPPTLEKQSGAVAATGGIQVPNITLAVQTPELLACVRASLDRVVHSGVRSLPRLVDSPAQALREVVSDRPNVLVLEMTASQAQQESTLAALGAIEPDGAPVSVLVVTPNTHLKLPALRGSRCCVHVFSGPVSLEWSRGCLAGMLTLLTSLQWGSPAAASGMPSRAALL